tara:strand:- start:7400 stop:7855 length:456 start_codon:yes stop_codon:yes gene_type:complete
MTFIIDKRTTERSQTNDLEYGLEREDGILDMIKANWSNAVNITNTKDRHNDPFCKWDFECDDGNTWELKSRRINFRKYPTSLLSHHKVRFDFEGDQYFVFNYLDQVVWCKYEKELWDTFKVTKTKVFRKSKWGEYTLENNWEIPINIMTVF